MKTELKFVLNNMFEKVVKFINEFNIGIKKVWEALPKELRAGVYIFISIAIKELVVQLELIKTDVWWLAGLINILLVFFTQVPTRVKTIKGK